MGRSWPKNAIDDDDDDELLSRSHPSQTHVFSLQIHIILVLLLRHLKYIYNIGRSITYRKVRKGHNNQGQWQEPCMKDKNNKDF